jgi:hypothetical protein
MPQIPVDAKDSQPNGLKRDACVCVSYTMNTIGIQRFRKGPWDNFKLTERNIQRLSRFTFHTAWIGQYGLHMDISPR